MKVGFAGLGDMGLPMARRPLVAGNEVIAWNRAGSKLRALEAPGCDLNVIGWRLPLDRTTGDQPMPSATVNLEAKGTPR